MDSKVTDFLTKQILIERNVVTFRSLSRQLNLHVNSAKNYLAEFHHTSMSSSDPAHATILLVGEARSKRITSHSDHMNVDSNPTSDRDEMGETVPLTKVVLVGEKDLEAAKSQYIRIFSEHIYSLSPAPLVDAGLVLEPSEKVYEVDAKTPAESLVLLGRVSGPHVRIGKFVPPVTLPKAQEHVPLKQVLSKGEEPKSEKSKDEHGRKEREEKLTKPKPSGTLNWSKARPKKDESSGKEKKNEKEKRDSVIDKSEESASSKGGSIRPSGFSKSEEAKPDVKKITKRQSALPAKSDSEDDNEENTKLPQKQNPLIKNKETTSSRSEVQGRKRKLKFPSESESESEPRGAVRASSSCTSTVKVKKGVIMSDEGEDEEMPARPATGGRKERAKGRSKEMSEAEKSWLYVYCATDEVIMASRPQPDAAFKEGGDTQSDVDMIEDSEPERIKTKPKKKKEKKVVPIGKNGLKKKRITKSRTRIDDKGYTITEDYSSYESVDEDQAEEASAKPKGKKSTPAKLKTVTTDDRTSSKTFGESGGSKSRKAAGKAGGQGSLMNFFGKNR
ncbi:uncharacterized protein FIBRA_06982 [Fibroporia radiculosa]|uniref:DNA polymerase delta subunit 3 n=1 Tax=Fibroporia radiculosa TaxID=599839 RepID=J4H4D2_9APHY|nr:uncharacterized protein FIBRA_06982 [Fibroporia radiculosa]CCM04789.1 predicted protein [Fibroporia radiculosa]